MNRQCTRRKTAFRDPNALVPHASVLTLDPAVLHAQAEDSVRTLLAEGESANTVRSYASALRYWAAWFRLRYREPIALPVPVPAVLQFPVDHVPHTAADGQLAHDLPLAIDEALVVGGFKAALVAPALNTVLHRLSVLSKAHQTRALASPTRDPGVQELVRRIRRAHAQRGELPEPKSALTKEPLEALLATCTDGLIGLRDAALLSFGFASGGRRRSEVAAATIERLTRIDPDTYLFQLTHSKTNQSATDKPENFKPIKGPAAHALTAWLEASGVVSGAIFRRIRGSVVAEPLAAQAVWHIVKRRAQLAGLDPDLYGAHSLQSGFVTESGRQNVPMKEALTMTGHRSVQTFLRYFQPGQMQVSRAANLLGGTIAIQPTTSNDPS